MDGTYLKKMMFTGEKWLKKSTCFVTLKVQSDFQIIKLGQWFEFGLYNIN